jgi:hypothetical protein
MVVVGNKKAGTQRAPALETRDSLFAYYKAYSLCSAVDVNRHKVHTSLEALCAYFNLVSTFEKLTHIFTGNHLTHVVANGVTYFAAVFEINRQNETCTSVYRVRVYVANASDAGRDSFNAQTRKGHIH